MRIPAFLRGTTIAEEKAAEEKRKEEKAAKERAADEMKVQEEIVAWEERMSACEKAAFEMGSGTVVEEVEEAE